MGNMSWDYWEHAGKLQVPVTLKQKEDHTKEISVNRMVDYLGKKEQCKKGLSFTNRNREEYIFDNEDEYEMTAKARTPAPFPYSCGSSGTLTKQEEMWG